MGFFSSIGRGIAGAAAGFATGGPLGAVAGGLSGLASGGGNTSSSSGSSSGGSTRSVDRRALTQEEQMLQARSYGSLAGNEGMTPEEAANRRQQEYDRIFGAQSGAINRTYSLAEDQGYAADARRGLAGSTGQGARTDARTGDRAFALSQASAQSEGQAQQQVLMEQEARRMAADSAMQRLNSIWSNQLADSTITTTGNQSRSGTSTTPDNFLGSVAGAVGSALTDENSWLNKRLNKKDAPLGAVQAPQRPWQGPQPTGLAGLN